MKARALDQRAHSGHIPGWRCQWHTKYSARTRERTHEPEQHPQRRGLPGTVGSDEPSDDAIGYLHVETIDDAPPAVAFGQPARLDRRTARDLLRHRSSHPLGVTHVVCAPRYEPRRRGASPKGGSQGGLLQGHSRRALAGSFVVKDMYASWLSPPDSCTGQASAFPRYRTCPAAPARVPPPSCGHLRMSTRGIIC